MAEKEKHIEEFINVTGADRDIAVHFLDACADNLETAITMFLDDKHESSKSGSSTTETIEQVRAPIPQTTGVLVNDPHYMTTSHDRWSSRRRPRTVFDAFRDFKAETKQQEDLMMSNTNQGRRLKRLEDLFRPPLELMHRGTFETARETGKTDHKWLMVNVQNVREFSCQVLNRDVWSKPVVQNLIRTNFIFWQVYSDSAEGDRFMTFYDVPSWPHVSILDPRTGERLTQWTDITVKSIQEKIEEFLVDHGSLHKSLTEPPSKRSKRDHSLIDDSEDTQLAAAIAASLKETITTTTVSDDDDYLTTNCSTDEISEFDGSSGDETPVEQTKTSLAEKMFKNGIENNKMRHLEETKLDNDFSSKKFSVKNGSGCIENKISCKTNEKIFPRKTRTNNIKENKSTRNENTKTTSKNDRKGSTIADSECDSQIGDVCHLMVRFPDGTREQMNMPANLMVKDLSDKLSERGFSSDHYEIVTNFPRRHISASSPEEMLKDVGLFPRATVFVQEKEC